MKLVLTTEEVKAIVLAHINRSFDTAFNDIVFDGYGQFKTATLDNVEPEQITEDL